MAMSRRLRVVSGEVGLNRGRGGMLQPRVRYAGSESPAHNHSDVELSRRDARYSHSCTDLTSYISLTTPRDTAHALCFRTRLSPTPQSQASRHHTPTSPTDSHPHHSPSPSDQSLQHPHANRQRRHQPRRPVTATVSAPRLATTTNIWKNHKPAKASPSRVDSALDRGVRNGRVGTQRHREVGPRVSWSPARQAPVAIRPRVLSDCYKRPSHLSRSFRIKQWIQARQRSSSQNTYVTVDEADDEGRPLGRHLDNIFEESDTDVRQRKKSRRRLGEFTTSRRKQWLTERGISPSSETSQENIEKDGNLEERLLEASTSWNVHAIHEHRMNALRSCLTAKNEPLLVLNLLEANKITEAVTMARESKTRVRLDVCLLWACVQGAAELVQMLLEAGANVDAKDNSGLSALHLAAEKGADDVLRALLKGGAKIGGPWEWDGNEEFTPLMLAARSGSLEAVRILIESGANTDAGLNTSGETALHQAVRAASPDCVQLLIEAGATINPTLLYSETPLHIAVSEGLADVVSILLEAGADVRASRGNSKMTPLHIAAQEGYCSVAHQLLKAGADPNQENLRGQTPLHLAAKAQSSDTVQLLLSFQANPNACDRDKKTPLHSGIFKGSRSHECLRLLLEAGADTNAADQSCHTPLHMAALHESSYCVLLFLDHGGDVTACTQGGVSALNLILRRTPTVLAHIQESLDAAISFTDHEFHDRDAQVQMDFRVLVPGEARGLECRMLSCFIKEGQKPLLKHPLCETLLFLKWLKVRSFFVLNLIFYALLEMSALSLPIHPISHNPTQAWEELRRSQKIIKLNVKTPQTPPDERMLRFVCMSDTHCLTSHLQFEIPYGDVFVHAGDFTRCGSASEVEEFNSWLSSLPHKHKIVIAGNHELSFDPKFTGQTSIKHHHKTAHTGDGLINEIPDLGMERDELKAAVSQTNTVDLITNAVYLQDQAHTICGIKLYGTPWQPEFCNWAFNVPRGRQCMEKWDVIPEDTDILITHTPPVGHGDLCCTGVRAGCVELLSAVQSRVKPKYHLFGHIHEGYGVTTDGKIIFINASTCNINYVPINPPVVFDVPIPLGFSK